MSSLRADYDPKYFLRFLLIAIGCLAFTGWCFYDALVKYPAELERAEVYWREVSNSGEKYKGMERDRWREVVAEKNWPTAPPEQPDKLRHNISSQYLYAAICCLIGIPCLIKWFLARGTWVENRERTVMSSWGESFDFQDVLSIDKSRWAKKGIARINYQSDGKTRNFVFDDFKYNRAVMGEILSRIEAGLTDEQISGDERESVKRARKKTEDAQAAEQPDGVRSEMPAYRDAEVEQLEEDSVS